MTTLTLAGELGKPTPSRYLKYRLSDSSKAARRGSVSRSLFSKLSRPDDDGRDGPLPGLRFLRKVATLPDREASPISPAWSKKSRFAAARSESPVLIISRMRVDS